MELPAKVRGTPMAMKTEEQKNEAYCRNDYLRLDSDN